MSWEEKQWWEVGDWGFLVLKEGFEETLPLRV